MVVYYLFSLLATRARLVEFAFSTVRYNLQHKYDEKINTVCSIRSYSQQQMILAQYKDWKRG